MKSGNPPFSRNKPKNEKKKTNTMNQKNLLFTIEQYTHTHTHRHENQKQQQQKKKIKKFY